MSALHDRLMAARADPDALDRKAESDLLVDLAPHVEDFIGELFGIAAEIRELQARHDELAPLYSVKRLFVQRRAVKGIKEADAARAERPASSADELDRADRRPAGRFRDAGRRARLGAALRRCRRALARRRGRAQAAAARRARIRRLGDAVAGRARPAQPRPVVQACRTGSTCTIWCRPKPSCARRHDAAPARRRMAAARRVRPDRPRHRSRRRARPGELLHLVPQPAEGQLPHGPAAKRTAASARASSASPWPAARSTRRSRR